MWVNLLIKKMFVKTNAKNLESQKWYSCIICINFEALTAVHFISMSRGHQRGCLGVCVCRREPRMWPFFVFLPRSRATFVRFSLSDPRVHARTRLGSPLLLRDWGQNGSLTVIFLKPPQEPTIKTNPPRVLFPQQWRHEAPPLPPRE